MPRIRLTKSAIDALPTPKSDIVYWDAAIPGFGVKVTPKGRKVFVVLYRTGGAGSKLRKYTIGPYGRVTLHQARLAAQKVFAAKLEGRDPAAEKPFQQILHTIRHHIALADLVNALPAPGLSDVPAKKPCDFSTGAVLREALGDEAAALEDHAVGVAEAIARALMPFARLAVGAKVVGKLPPLGHLLDDLRVADEVLRDDVVIVEQLVVPRGRLAVDQTPSLDRGLFRILLFPESSPA
jgi:hypothetical protein